MRDWLFCILEILVYTFGVMGCCALVVEQCHRAIYALLGRRVGRVFWYATALPGAPVHELGHALMCLIFGHRIERCRLFPTRRGAACVEHSYTLRNPWAAFGNLPIALGPILSGLAVMLGVLALLFPQTLTIYTDAVAQLQAQSLTLPQAAAASLSMVRALVSETAVPLLPRIFGGYLLLSMSLHVRLSVADLRGMAPGIPYAVLLSALAATVITLAGADALATTTAALQAFALLQCALFALILLFSLLCLAAAAVWRMIVGIVKL